jgi:glucose 1-dehydrogenase
MRLNGKTALVTGAARGIGRGCALELARAGADVAINDRVKTEPAEAVIAEIQAMGRRSVLVDGDAFQRPSCERIVAGAIAALGRIDILISNPAYQRRADFLEYDPETFAKVIEGTLIGGFHMSQLVARHMVDRGGGGKIVFISSCHVKTPYARSVAYNAGKGGLNLMAFTIAAELCRHRINVNVIEPGWIDTPGEHESAMRLPGLDRRSPGAGSARPRTSARPPSSSPPTTPTTSPAPPWPSTVASGFARPGSDRFVASRAEGRIPFMRQNRGFKKRFGLG